MSNEPNHLKDERDRLQAELWEQARLLEERNAELRRANSELRRVDQLKSDFVSMVSHELRTPLATVKEFIEILSDQIAGPVTPDQRTYLTIIRENVNRLARIIDDLLDMAKIEAGRVALDRGLVPVASLLEHVRQSIQPLADQQGLRVELAVPIELPGVFADADKITQVLMNLVSNAVKFTKATGRVTISVVEHPSEVEFRVTDTGCGIAPEDLPKLFERFPQVRPSAPVQGAKGTGLGLAISKRLVELHGGRIWASSTPGAGSTFSFTLPKYHMEEVLREHLRAGIEQARHQEGRLSVIAVSVSNLPDLKALYGLEETTQLFAELEALVKGIVRQRDGGDLVLRWLQGGGLVALVGVEKALAQGLAARIMRLARERAFLVAGKPISVALAVAVVAYPEDGRTDEELLGLLQRRLVSPTRSKTRILVIDDEASIRQFLKGVLEFREYEVLTAASGPDALEQLKSQPVDLILLDLMMPVMSGYEVYHLLKEEPRTKDIPVIIVTGQGERKDRQLGMEAAPYNYVGKPFQVEDLLAKVRDVLVQRQSVGS